MGVGRASASARDATIAFVVAPHPQDAVVCALSGTTGGGDAINTSGMLDHTSCPGDVARLSGLTPGHYTFTVTDTVTHASASTTFTVGSAKAAQVKISGVVRSHASATAFEVVFATSGDVTATTCELNAKTAGGDAINTAGMVDACAGGVIKLTGLKVGSYVLTVTVSGPYGGASATQQFTVTSSTTLAVTSVSVARYRATDTSFQNYLSPLPGMSLMWPAHLTPPPFPATATRRSCRTSAWERHTFAVTITGPHGSASKTVKFKVT